MALTQHEVLKSKFKIFTLKTVVVGRAFSGSIGLVNITKSNST